MVEARSVRVRGTVQGVGFRPFVFRLAQAHALAGWVLNHEEGVEIHLEGADAALEAFLRGLMSGAPPAARIASVDVVAAEAAGLRDFEIRHSRSGSRPAARISPDLAVCPECLGELFDPAARRYRYPYINCTQCGPRYSIVRRLPYDRGGTTMRDWAMDDYCAAQYGDPADRRFHAQPIACPACGPHYYLEASDGDDIARTAQLLAGGAIVAIKGLGGYHLACDARNAHSVQLLRERKYRKERPFAVMAADPGTACELAEFEGEATKLLVSAARPIVLAPARASLPGVAPDTGELGVMLPYTPVHYLLFRAGAPEVLAMTSANRSNEPIAYRDEEARESLAGIADAFLMGERPIARRVDDSVARAGVFGPVVLRRARGYAPGVVANLPVRRPVLALGADLKNSLTLVVDGQAIVSQHIGDLEHHEASQAFRETIADLLAMYDLQVQELLVVHDAHPEYSSTQYALGLPAQERMAVQHHRAHIASVLAEREAWDQRVLGVAWDGTGYGDDGSIWGGEIFAGSLRRGLERTAHLRPAVLPGGDAAARHPVQAAAGFLAQLEDAPQFEAAPFDFPERYRQAAALVSRAVRVFPTTSTGRLFDTAAALAGFVRPVSFEGQAAMWLEHLARKSASRKAYPFPLDGQELDFRPLLDAFVRDRRRGEDPATSARAFHRGLARGLAHALELLVRVERLRTIVLSGGVFQNQLLLEDLREALDGRRLEIWTNTAVPPNDGGISLGQAALAAVGECHA